MRRIIPIFIALLAFFGTVQAAEVVVLTVDGPITPVTARYLMDGVAKAERENAAAVVIQMDTPGGLMQSMLSIDKRLLAAQVPVIVHVSPPGGRAASAGVFISYAAHLVAMAPSTNIGSAHPVSMGMGGGKQDSSAVMMEKITNDAVSHIRGLARKRGRNADWAEEAVRHSVNITEEEALKLKVIDLVARDLSDLLQQLDGRTVQVDDQDVTLHTAGAAVIRRPMNWRYQILDKIADPNIAYLLMLGGVMGLFFELRSPGALFPGILGGISLILAFFAMQVLPINAAGVLLIVLAVLFFILEAYTPTFGFLTIGGVVAMLLGSLMLFRSPEIFVSLAVIIPSVIGLALFFLLVAAMALKAQTRKVVTGDQGLVGEEGKVLRAMDGGWQVAVHGEIWRATSSTPLKKGDAVVVTAVRGMVVEVQKK